MTELRQRYAKLSEAYHSRSNASNLLALFGFKDELEATLSDEAKHVLVDVYRLLGFNKSAFNLFGQIVDKSDKKQLKKLGSLHESSQYGDFGALKRPKMTSGQTKLKKLPHFRYHPDPFETDVFKDDMSVVCECCGKETSVYYDGSVYSVDDVEYLCPWCIASGKATKKFDATFIGDAEELATNDPKKSRELFERTPGFVSWQGEYWLACCDDYCEFLGYVGTTKLEQMGIADEVFDEYEKRTGYDDPREYLTSDGDVVGYLFRCLHCGKYKIHTDMS